MFRMSYRKIIFFSALTLVIKLVALLYMENFGSAGWEDALFSIGPEYSSSDYIVKGMIIGADISILLFLYHWNPNKKDKVLLYYWCNPILLYFYYYSGQVCGFIPLIMIGLLYAIKDQDHKTSSLLTFALLVLLPQGILYLPLFLVHYISSSYSKIDRWRFIYPFLLSMYLLLKFSTGPISEISPWFFNEMSTYLQLAVFQVDTYLIGAIVVAWMIPLALKYLYGFSLLMQVTVLAMALSLISLQPTDWVLLVTLASQVYIKKTEDTVY